MMKSICNKCGTPTADEQAHYAACWNAWRKAWAEAVTVKPG